MGNCDLLDICGFFLKYSSRQSAACDAFVQEYCRGEKQDRCKRKVYRKAQGKVPPDNMLPVGGMLPDNF